MQPRRPGVQCAPGRCLGFAPTPLRGTSTEAWRHQGRPRRRTQALSVGLPRRPPSAPSCPPPPPPSARLAAQLGPMRRNACQVPRRASSRLQVQAAATARPGQCANPLRACPWPACQPAHPSYLPSGLPPPPLLGLPIIHRLGLHPNKPPPRPSSSPRLCPHAPARALGCLGASHPPSPSAKALAACRHGRGQRLNTAPSTPSGHVTPSVTEHQRGWPIRNGRHREARGSQQGMRTPRPGRALHATSCAPADHGLQSYIVRWVKVDQEQTLSWSVQPNKKSM